jgi:mannose-6-phosphate isomerase
MTSSRSERSADLPPALRGPIRLGDNRVFRPYRGGRLLAQFVGGGPGEDGFYPEDWLGSDTPAVGSAEPGGVGISRLTVGGQEVVLTDLLQAHGEAILGPEHVARFGCRTALLVKLLDSAERLQIQSHPSAQFVRRHLAGQFGKAESWLILATREIAGQKPYVLLGWKESIDPAELAQAVLSQDIDFMESRLHRFQVEPGHLFHVPPAMPHAIGPGCFLMEVQEPSDWVFLPEFPQITTQAGEKVTLPLEFCCLQGLPLETAIQSMRLDGISCEDVIAGFRMSEAFNSAPGVRTLLSTPEFRIDEIVGKGAEPLTVEERFFAIAIGERGELRLEGEQFETTICRRGDRLLIPWSAGPFQVRGEGRVIVAQPQVGVDLGIGGC